MFFFPYVSLPEDNGDKLSHVINRGWLEHPRTKWSFSSLANYGFEMYQQDSRARCAECTSLVCLVVWNISVHLGLMDYSGLMDFNGL